MIDEVRVWRIAAGVAFVVLGAACSLLTSTDGLSGAADGAGTPGPDAAPDTTADAASDGANGSDGSAATFCAAFTSTALCDDFERDSGVQGPWTSLQVKAPGTLTLVSEANNTFLRAATSGTGGSTDQLALHFAVPAEQASFSISYRMRISDTFDDGTYGEVTTLSLPRGDLNYRAIYIQLTRTSAALAYNVVTADGGGSNENANFTFTRGAWQTTTMSVDLAAGTATVFIGKTAVANVKLPATLFAPTTMDVVLGLAYAQESTGTLPVLDVDFDDVTISFPAAPARP
jgi:hypothetical protein